MLWHASKACEDRQLSVPPVKCDMFAHCAVQGRGDRPYEPHETAEAITFLSSDAATLIAGQLLSVDGGATVR